MSSFTECRALLQLVRIFKSGLWCSFWRLHEGHYKAGDDKALRNPSLVFNNLFPARMLARIVTLISGFLTTAYNYSALSYTMLCNNYDRMFSLDVCIWYSAPEALLIDWVGLLLMSKFDTVKPSSRRIEVIYPTYLMSNFLCTGWWIIGCRSECDHIQWTSELHHYPFIYVSWYLDEFSISNFFNGCRLSVGKLFNVAKGLICSWESLHVVRLFRKNLILGSYRDLGVHNEYVFLFYGSVFEKETYNLFLQLDLICCTTGTEAWIQKLK